MPNPIGCLAMKLAKMVLATSLLVAAPAAYSTVILDVDGNGQLLGASGVIVLSQSYDVVFLDGTCAGLFNGCDNVTDFAFTNATTASHARNALQLQVFFDGTEGQFHTDPELTRGCTDLVVCRALIPFNLSGGQVTAVSYDNWAGGAGGGVYTYLATGAPNIVDAQWTYAVFTPTTSVPEPGALLLLSLGVIVAGVSRRKAT